MIPSVTRMAPVTQVVVVGGGVASAAAIAALRSGGFDGGITLVTEEDTVPYERPPLSKEFLLADAGAGGGPALVRDADWYSGQDVELLLGTRATEIDLAARTVTVDGSGTPLRYDALLLATGVRPRRLPGLDGDAIRYLRTFGDAVGLRERIRAAEHVAVLGGGFIGCEVAAAAVRLGKRATILEALPTLLHRALGPVLGEAVVGLHRAEGVDVRTGITVTGVASRDGGGVLVSTEDGTLCCDLLVVGVGTVPNTELAAVAGLPVAPPSAGGGIETDEYLAAAPGVYAVGDVAAQYLPSHGRRIRVEHHDTAIRQGTAAARSILGHRDPFSGVHWFWSDQYEHSIQSVGIPDGTEHRIVRGSLDGGSFSAFSLDGDKIRAVISLNRPKDVIETRRLIARDHSVTADQLRDESVSIKRLAAPARPAAVRPLIACTRGHHLMTQALAAGFLVADPRLRVPPAEARAAIEAVIGRSAVAARARLRFGPGRTCERLGRLLDTAIGRAENAGLDPANLIVASGAAEAGEDVVRVRRKAHGDADWIATPTSQVRIVLRPVGLTAAEPVPADTTPIGTERVGTDPVDTASADAAPEVGTREADMAETTDERPAAAVREALYGVIDPDLGVNVVDLGFVRGITVRDATAVLTMTLTSAACPLTKIMEDQIRDALAPVPDIRDFRLDWEWIPAWRPSDITPDGRDQLAAIGFTF